MNRKLHSTFELLETQRLQLFNEIRSLPDDVLTAAPQGKWSILRILSHIMAGEKTGLEYVRKKILGVERLGESGLWEESKMLGLVLSQRLTFLKYKSPRLIEERTVEYRDLATLEVKWNELRGEWRSFLEGIPDQFANRNIFRHVLAGRMSINQGLLFFREHITHHKPQIRQRIAEWDESFRQQTK